jgi:uncharacterized protein (TIGR02145 family)
MAENLKTTRFNDGTAIDLVTNNEAWKHMFFSYTYCCYNNVKPGYKWTYGALYNFITATAQLCPLGWHLPSDDE